MMNKESNVRTLKANLKNIKIIRSLQSSHAGLVAEVERIIILAEQAYKITRIPELLTVIKNAEKVLRLYQLDSYTDCHIYAIQINKLVESIVAIESKLIVALSSDSNDILLGFREAFLHIGSVFSA